MGIKPLSELVIASHNVGKVREIGELIAPIGIEIISAAELNLPEPEENGDTFEANAALKAESAAIISGKPSLADDSGLAIPALNDAPGIYSARWAGPDKDFAMAMERIKQEVEATGRDAQGAAAYFVCVLALAAPGEETLFFRGEAHGTLTFPPQGKEGFGYDPIFVPNDQNMTFGQMSPEDKHTISHRANAFVLFLDYLKA